MCWDKVMMMMMMMIHVSYVDNFGEILHTFKLQNVCHFHILFEHFFFFN